MFSTSGSVTITSFLTHLHVDLMLNHFQTCLSRVVWIDKTTQSVKNPPCSNKSISVYRVSFGKVSQAFKYLWFSLDFEERSKDELIVAPRSQLPSKVHINQHRTTNFQLWRFKICNPVLESWLHRRRSAPVSLKIYARGLTTIQASHLWTTLAYHQRNEKRFPFAEPVDEQGNQ